MREDAYDGSHEMAAVGLAGNPGMLYRAGRVLLAAGLVAVALACLCERWDSHGPKAGPLLFYIHNLLGAALILSAVGIGATRRMRAWAAFLGALALLAAVFFGAYPYWGVVDTRDELLRVSFIGAMLMLAGLEQHREGKISRWFRAGRWIFGVAALISIAAENLVSMHLQAGDDMFYQNYDVNTLFNSIWAWNRPLTHPLGTFFGMLALLGAVLHLFRRRERAGAICLAAASVLFLPLFFLYRCDDFFGDKRALVEVAYCWALDLGVAGGALVVAAAFRRARSEGVHCWWLAERAGSFFRRLWVRAAMSFAGIVLLAAVIFHGLIPFFFYEANSRGHAMPGDWTTRLFAATYFPVNGNTYLTEGLLQAAIGAGPAGRACAANDANGCENFSDFYRQIGWNWGRAWTLSVKAAALFAAKCENGDTQACFELGVQYENGRGVAADLNKAEALYQKTCDARWADGCQKLGDMCWYGIGVKADKHKGAVLLKKGCALGSQWACQRLDFMRRYDPDWRPEFDQ